ncbi:hypothetical protein O181_024623 [Austropuccinia psidii MF-1]|uniref:Uncharacterized protein n=1 Tax=Austropuccinia psidii MF-1 TaxID=1389203 RepID=A0A9Q3CJ89_9BASI|nr:hypothetical protein [Austropuccinia psidii MF-1]
MPQGSQPVYSNSEVPISRINKKVVVKIIRIIAHSPTNPDAEGSVELDGDAVEVVLESVGHQCNTSPSQPAATRLQSQVIPSTPRNVQQVLSTITSYISPPSPNPSTARPAMDSPVSPPPIPPPRNSPMVTSQKLQLVASSSKRREDPFPFLFPATQVFQKMEHWPIWVSREDLNMANEVLDSVVSLFRIIDRNSREVITYAKDRMIPGTASENMDSNFAWYEDEFINKFQRNFVTWVDITSFLFLVYVWLGFYPHSYKILKIYEEVKK